jgi:hypothetical protein
MHVIYKFMGMFCVVALLDSGVDGRGMLQNGIRAAKANLRLCRISRPVGGWGCYIIHLGRHVIVTKVKDHVPSL